MFLHGQLVVILAGKTAIFGLRDNDPCTFTRALFSTWRSSQVHDRSSEEFTRTGRNIWNAGHQRPTSTDTRQAAVGCTLACLVAHELTRGKESLRGRQGARHSQGASVIEFELRPSKEAGLSVSTLSTRPPAVVSR